jgi:hypothetical protein
MWPIDKSKIDGVFFKTVKKQKYRQGPTVEGRSKVQNYVVGNRFPSQKKIMEAFQARN